MQEHLETPTAQKDRLISFPEALRTLGVSKSSAYRLLEKGALPQPVKIGTRTFFSEREIQGWIANKLAARGQEVSHG